VGDTAIKKTGSAGTNKSLTREESLGRRSSGDTGAQLIRRAADTIGEEEGRERLTPADPRGLMGRVPETSSKKKKHGNDRFTHNEQWDP